MSVNRLPENPNQKRSFEGKELKDIYLAGGCFWGVEAFLSRVYGVADATVGYANGSTENPTYQEVCHKNTGHAETVHVKYDPTTISLKDLLVYFFSIIDPTSFNRQGNDRGAQYRTGIYYTHPEDLSVIRAVLTDEQEKYDKPIVTEVVPLTTYYLAEEYHQDYLEKNPGGYCHISFEGLENQM